MKSYYPIAVEILDDYCLKILFDNQEKRIFDVKPYLLDPFFKPIASKTVFDTVRINSITIEWDCEDGEDGEIDICPDELYYNSVLCVD